METKKEMKFFTVVDFDREEDYLRRMHQSGWKLSKVKFRPQKFTRTRIPTLFMIFTRKPKYTRWWSVSTTSPTSRTIRS